MVKWTQVDESDSVMACVECSPVILEVKPESNGFLEGHFDGVERTCGHV